MAALSGLDRYFSLGGKTALVTGATSGIGLAIAEAFAAAGASVAVSSNEAGRCREVAAQLSAEGGKAIGIACDVRDAGALAALAEAATARLGGIDILVCNAGVSLHHGSLSDVSDNLVEETFAVNLKHPLRLTGLVAPGMAARGGGSIILTASLAGLRGNKAIGLYALTKAALMQLARNLAVEWGPSGVTANAIAPGLIDTAWTSALLSNEAQTARRLAATPLRRVGKSFEVAAAALFLASPGGGFVTGHTLVVDGGTLISDGN